MLVASPSLLRRTAAAARPAARARPPLLAPISRAAARSARRSLLTRPRAVPLGDNGDGDDEAKKSSDGDETPTPQHPRRGRPSSRDTARALEALRGPSHQKIGAEYGEGFVQFRVGGQPLSLDVDALNERLSPAGALRLRRALLAPDEAHGALFSFEGVIADTRAAQAEAWRRVSHRRALAWPPREVSLWGSGGESPSPSAAPSSRASAPDSSSPSRLLPPRVALVCSLRPERAITEVLQWTRDYGLAGKIAAEVAHEYLAIVRGDDDEHDENDDGSKEKKATQQNEHLFSSPRPGVARWLAALRSARVPCSVVTSLDRRTLLSALERMGLLGDGSDDLLLPRSATAAFVTAEDGAESLAHSFLAASLKLGRPPNACCAFVSSPAGVAAAHNASMRAVAVVNAGEHSSHELRSADATVSRLDELAVIQVRRLFASGGSEGEPGAFMGKQKERAPGAGGGTGADGSWFDADADAAARRQSRRRRVAGGVVEPEAAPGSGSGGRNGGRGGNDGDDGGDWRRRR